MRSDLILLGIDRDGESLLQSVERIKRSNGATSVIVMSRIRENDIMVRSLEMGAEDYLFKPVDPEELAARIQAVSVRILSGSPLRNCPHSKK